MAKIQLNQACSCIGSAVSQLCRKESGKIAADIVKFQGTVQPCPDADVVLDNRLWGVISVIVSVIVGCAKPGVADIMTPPSEAWRGKLREVFF